MKGHVFNQVSSTFLLLGDESKAEGANIGDRSDLSIQHLQVSASHCNLSITLQGTEDRASHQMVEAQMKSRL